MSKTDKRRRFRSEFIRGAFSKFAATFLPPPEDRDASDRLVEYAFIRGFMDGFYLAGGMETLNLSPEEVARIREGIQREATTLEKRFFRLEIEDLVASGALDMPEESKT